ncbi:hypothetical protein CU098_005648, partial [Rhizopus stolonifer]
QGRIEFSRLFIQFSTINMIKIFSFTVLSAFVFSGIQAASLADFTEIGLGGKCSLSSKVRCDSSTVCQNGICIYRSTVVSRSVHCDQLLSVRGYHGPVLSVGNYCFAENKCDGLYHALTVDVDLLKADSLCEQYGNYCAPKPSGSTKGHGLITHLLDCGLGDCDKQDEANMEEQSDSTKGHGLLSHLLDCGSDECVKQDAASMEEESPKQQEEETSNPPGSTKGHGLLTHLLDCDSECDKQDATSTEK